MKDPVNGTDRGILKQYQAAVKTADLWVQASKQQAFIAFILMKTQIR